MAQGLDGFAPGGLCGLNLQIQHAAPGFRRPPQDFHLFGDRAPEAPAVRSFAEKQRARPGAVPGRGLAPQLYHEATKLVPSAPVERAAPVPTPTARSGSGVPLPKAGAAPSAAVERTISERRSAEEFFEKPLALGDLGFVLEMAQGHAALERAPGVELFVAVHRVQGLEDLYELPRHLFERHPQSPRLLHFVHGAR